jgi:ATP-dependent helicase HrpA
VAPPASAARPPVAEPARHVDWTFGELPELMEVRRGAQTLVGFPALIDRTTHVEIEVFDEPDAAAAAHRLGLRRLFALQLRDTLKALDRQLPDQTAMGAAFLQLGGTLDELKRQVIEVAIDRAFLGDPLPTDAAGFRRRLEQGRGRLVLIAHEVARQAGVVLVEHQAAQRKLKDARQAPKDAAADVAAQLARLVGRRFIAETPWERLAHLPRYLKAVALRLDKLRTDPERDAARMAEIRPMEQRLARALAERKGVADARLDDLRWQLEELRVSLFAQELKTPQPVSVKRLEKAWAMLER